MLKIIGHRFFSGHNPENSLSGIRFSISNNAWAAETDVQLTKDGVPVLIHDKTLNRTTNCSGYVKDYTWQELSYYCNLSNGEPVPTLEECLDILCGRGIRLYLELISPDFNDYLTIKKLLTHYSDGIDIVLSSFHHSLLKEIKEDDKTRTTMALFECNPVHPISFFRDSLADEAGIGFDSITKQLVDILTSNAIDVYAWTVNNRQETGRAAELGVCGIFSDYIFHHDGAG